MGEPGDPAGPWDRSEKKRAQTQCVHALIPLGSQELQRPAGHHV